jgi:hypothetical protein
MPEQLVDAHQCTNGYIRLYPMIFCSICMGRGIDVQAPRVAIDALNKAWREQQEQQKEVRHGK